MTDWHRHDEIEGMGLAICKKIVERHGGVIRVGSEPGDGGRFSFALRAADPAGREADRRAALTF